jgi:hypothetical protein
MMSREKQIEDIQNTLIKIAKQPIMIEGLEHWSDAIAEALYNANCRKQEWISVEERLPEDTIPDDYKHKTIKVLVAIRGKNGVTIRTQQRFLDYTYRDDKRTAFWTWRFSGGDVTHWMPLPEAPKGGAE